MVGAGRTDAGVHAWGQVCSFSSRNSRKWCFRSSQYVLFTVTLQRFPCFSCCGNTLDLSSIHISIEFMTNAFLISPFILFIIIGFHQFVNMHPSCYPRLHTSSHLLITIAWRVFMLHLMAFFPLKSEWEKSDLYVPSFMLGSLQLVSYIITRSITMQSWIHFKVLMPIIVVINSTQFWWGRLHHILLEGMTLPLSLMHHTMMEWSILWKKSSASMSKKWYFIGSYSFLLTCFFVIYLLLI